MKSNNIDILIRAILVIFAFVHGCSVLGQIDIARFSSEVDSIVHEAIAQQAFPGARVLIMHRNEPLIDRAYGFHTYDSVRAVDLNDIYDFASVTKITSVVPAVMILVDRGQFDLDATLGENLPDFSRSDKGNLPWRQILAHDARLHPWIPYWKNTIRRNGKFKARTFKAQRSKRYPIQVSENLYLHRKYRKKMMKAIRKSPLNEEEGYVYSGLAFYLLPGIVEDITGVDFEDFLKMKVFGPIGAESLGYNPLERFSKDRIVPTEKDTFFRMTQIHGRVHDEGAAMMGGVSGNAGLFGTAGDLAKLGKLYLQRGIWEGDTIIDPLVVDEFTRCQYCYKGNRRGLGFDKPPWTVDPGAESVTISPDASAGSYGHSGYTGTLLWVDPENDLIFVFLSNRVYPTRLNTKINDLKVRPAIHHAAYRAIGVTRKN